MRSLKKTCCIGGLKDLQIHCRAFPIPSGLKLVGNLLIFIKPSESSTLNRGNVYENILAAIFRLDETIPFCWVEPFDCTSRHLILLCGAVAPVFNLTRAPCVGYQIVFGNAA